MFFFFNDTATTEIYTLSLHDALPISFTQSSVGYFFLAFLIVSGAASLALYVTRLPLLVAEARDRKSTRLNSSHLGISYAVFCLKKKIPSRRESDHAPGRTADQAQ